MKGGKLTVGTTPVRVPVGQVRWPLLLGLWLRARESPAGPIACQRGGWHVHRPYISGDTPQHRTGHPP
jgi:hypothetical protein